MPKSTDLNYKLEECTQKIMDLQHELADAMNDLADVNCAIVRVIREVKNYDYQDLLVKRYVFGEPWEKIATDLGYSVRHSRMQAFIFPAAVSGKSRLWFWAAALINGFMNLCSSAGRNPANTNGTQVARKPPSGNMTSPRRTVIIRP